MWSGVIAPANDAFDLFEFVHEALLVLQAAGCIRKQDIDVPGFCGIPGIEYNRRRICARLLRNNRDIISFAPGLQLFDSGRTKRIACGKHDRQALLFESIRQLANSRGLARAIYADHQDDKRIFLRAYLKRHRDALKYSKQRSTQAFAERLDILEFFACEAFLQICNDLLGRVDADVSHDQ